MAHAAAVSEKGPVRNNNQDACCVMAAKAGSNEMAMGVVCDGVGGLEFGETASATVVLRFARWFEEELPRLASRGPIDLNAIRDNWSAMLSDLNELIRVHTASSEMGVGTTFSGIFAADGRYLAAQVGDSRIYQVGPHIFSQITEDQTLVAHGVIEGTITAEEARTHAKRHVILQSVGTERALKPVFSKGSYAAGDLFVLCSDGAYRLPDSEGIRTMFQRIDLSDNDALASRCNLLVEQNVQHGEKDNITVACFSMDTGPATSSWDSGEDGLPILLRNEGADDEDHIPTMVRHKGVGEEDDLPTAVLACDVADGEDEISTATFPRQDVGCSGDGMRRIEGRDA